MTLTVARYDGPGDDWDSVVRASTGGTHFHRWGWKAVMERVFRHDCPYLAARDETGALVGVLPLVRVRSVLFGHYLVSMPFLNYGGPLGSDAAVQALAAHAVMLADEAGARLLELRSLEPLPLSLHVSHRKITVIRDLPPEGPDALFAAFDRKLRGRIRRPQKEGVAVRFGPQELPGFYQVFSHHMRDLGTPALPYALFTALAQAFPDEFHVGVAYVDGRAAACGAGFRWGDHYEMTWGSALRAYNNLSPNMLLYWAFMERSMAGGVRLFNFGRCSPGSGTHEFKRQWGSRDVPLYWYQHTPGAGAAEEAATPSPDQGAWSWGPRLWQRLPVAIATAIGPRIVRFIP